MRRALPLLLLPATALAGAKDVARKAGYTQVRVLGGGTPTVLAATRHDADGDEDRLLFVLGKTLLDVDDLAVGVARHPRVRVGTFLGDKRYLDVEVSGWWSNGMRSTATDTHYVVRRAAPAVVCSFAGDSSSGNEDVTGSSTVTIKKVSARPLAWDVTVKIQSGHERAPDEVTHYQLPDDGACTSDEEGGDPLDLKDL